MTKRLLMGCLLSFFLLCFVSSAFSEKDVSRPDSFKRVNSDYVLSGWTVVNDGKNNGPSAWFIADGIITQSSNLYGGSNTGNNPDKPGTYALNGEKDWTDYTMSVDLRSRDDDAIGVMFRYQDTQNYYRFSMDRQRNYRRLLKKVDGKVTVLAEDQFSYEMNKWYTIKVNINRYQIEIYMDNKRVFRVADNSIPYGQIGLYSWGNAGSDFRDLLMTLNSGWVIVDEGSFEAPSLWSVKDGIIYQSSNISGGSDEKNDLEKPGTYVINGDSGWTDYELNVDLRSTDDDAIGVMFRYVNSKNYYRFSMDRERRYRRLIKKVDGKISILAEDSTPYVQSKWYKIKIRVSGNSIKILINNKKIFAVDDDSISSGKVCMYCWGNSGSEFKNLIVTALDDYKENDKQNNDTKSPITAMEGTQKADTDQTGNYVEIVGEDQLEDQFIDYLTTEDSKNQLEDLSDIAEEYVEPERNMEAHNFPEDWIVVDDGRYGRPSSWSMVKGVVLQTSNIYGGSDMAVAPVKPGTYLVNGKAEWKDYVFTGKIRSVDDDAVGIMFRYQDDNNYYRFSMDRQRQYRRLIKKVDGYVITLAEDTWAYDMNKWYSFKVVLSGSRLKIFIDNKSIFDIVDSDISSGKIGRYCWGNEGAEFKKFKVTQVAPIDAKQKIVDSDKKEANEKDTKIIQECDKLVKLEKRLKDLQKEVLRFRKECQCYE